jgi:Tol biopolymer transport system component
MHTRPGRRWLLPRTFGPAALRILFLVAVAACGEPTSPPVENPQPQIHALSPTSAEVGEAELTLTVQGTGFVAQSSVRWNGATRPTTHLSSTELTARLSAADLASAGEAEVTVLNPAPGGGASNTAIFALHRVVDRVEVGRAYPSTFVGDTTRLRATVIGLQGDTLESRLIQWTSEDPTIASVTPDGVVHGVAPGVVRIRAASGGATGAVVVAVLARTLRTNREIAYERSSGSPLRSEIQAMRPGDAQSTTISVPGENVSDFAWSPDGEHLVISYAGYPGDQLRGSYIVAADGSAARSLGEFLWTPRWSPDGRRLVYRNYISFGESDVYTMSVEGGDRRRLTSSPGDDLEPQWSPDGRQIAYLGSGAGGQKELRLIAANGSDPRVLALPTPVQDARWSPDGKHIAFSSAGGIWVVTAEGTGLRPLTANCTVDGVCTPAGRFASPAWSPDGKRIAYSRLLETGACQMIIAQADGTGEVVVEAGAWCGAFWNTFPQWSPDGSQVLFQSENPGGWPGVSLVNADGSARQYVTGAENAYRARWRP